MLSSFLVGEGTGETVAWARHGESVERFVCLPRDFQQAVHNSTSFAAARAARRSEFVEPFFDLGGVVVGNRF